MNLALNKPYQYFFLIIPFILALAYNKSKEIFDINIHDTYFVIQYSHFGILLSLFFFLLGLIHFFLSKKGMDLNNWITYTHTIISIGGLILIWLLLKKINNEPTQNIEEMLKSTRINAYLNFSSIMIFISILLIQVIFFIGILWKLAKNLFSA